MAPKIDKEMLIKHHFWIGTGLCVLLVLIPLFTLIGGVSDAVSKERDALLAKRKQADGVILPKNEKWVAAYEVQDKIVEGQQNKVWKEAYEAQKDFMSWPPSFIQQYPAFRNKQFGDPINTFEANDFGTFFAEQIKDVLLSVNPLLPPPNDRLVAEPAVQFKGSWNAVLQFRDKFATMPPSREDIWLAQEDLWVKRELLGVVRAANDAVARLNEVKPPQPQHPAAPAAKTAKDANDAQDGKAKDANPKDAKVAKAPPRRLPAPVTDQNHKVFRNYSWEMELHLSRGARQKFYLSGKLTNVGKRRQPVGVFKVRMDEALDAAPSYLDVQHEPLAVGQSVEFKDVAVNEGVNISGLHGVEEALNWRSAAVKRIDDLRLDYAASRLARRGLVEPRWVDKAPAAPDAGTTGVQGGMGMGGAGGMGMSMGLSGPGGVGGSGQGSTKNGYTTKRYIDTNEQVRHMPVALVVVVDEDYIHEFLAAFSNSRLRTQTLQYHWRHFRDKIKPESESLAAGETEKGGKSPPAGKLPADAGEARMGMNLGGGRGGMGTPGIGMMMGGGRMGPGGFGGNAFAPKDDEEEADMNLVELSVYGLASLYENPAKPAAPPPGSDTTTAAPK